MGGFYSVISFSLIAERQGLAVKMDDSFLISLGFSCQLKSQDFWRLHWIFFFFFRTECCVTSAMLLCLKRCICLVSNWQGCYGKGTDRLSPHYQPVARDRLLFAHTNLCLQIVQQAVMQKPSGMGVNGLCCVYLSHLVIQSFHSACFTARGLWKGKKNTLCMGLLLHCWENDF